MQKPIIEQLGKQMREKMPVSNDLPLPIMKTLARLAKAEELAKCEESGAAPASNSN